LGIVAGRREHGALDQRVYQRQSPGCHREALPTRDSNE
jgi:hypothetical protein